jgi:hypothetical protein
MCVIARDFESSFLRALRSPPDNGGRVMFRSHSAHLLRTRGAYGLRARIRARRAGPRNRPRCWAKAVAALQPVGVAAENVCLSGKTGSNRRRVKTTRLPSRPGEFHPEPLTDSGREPLDSSGSCHRAKAAAFH